MHGQVNLASTDWHEHEGILSGLGAGIVVDLTGKILLFAEYYENSLDLRREEVLGRHVMEVFEDHVFMETIATGETLFTELKGKHDKSQFVTIIPLTDDGNIVGAAGINIFRDMDKVRRFASKISNFTSELAYYKEAVKKSSGKRTSVLNRSLITLKEAREEAEKQAIMNAIKKAGGNKQKAADILAIHRTSLYYKLREYHMIYD